MIVGIITSLIGGPIAKALLSGYKAKLSAANEQDRIAADLAIKEIEADIEARAQQAAIVKAEQGWWLTAIIRPLFAFPLIAYWFKIIFYDKMLGWGTTDALEGAVGEWAMMIIGAYFIGRSAEKVARIMRR